MCRFATDRLSHFELFWTMRTVSDFHCDTKTRGAACSQDFMSRWAIRSMADPVQMQFTIPSDTAKGLEVQDRILAALQQHQFTQRDLFGVKLALEEAIVNAIKHGNGMDPAKSVDIQCELNGDRVSIVIEDEGDGFDPATVPDPTIGENLQKPGGRGLKLMRAFMTSVEYNALGNRVSLEKIRSLDQAD